MYLAKQYSYLNSIRVGLKVSPSEPLEDGIAWAAIRVHCYDIQLQRC